ncbi:hypothetical protein SAMN05216228_100653 [Rhizobium tibeticum]|uniref:Uncharacterized protein n=1 Tax=Rhizobium tibeticum TaxID=501024 RepID=A0ABY1AIV2_9HYPH|nr:hypothetical protein SAMN05216228_100653 [Rhizobium tibeticum]
MLRGKRDFRPNRQKIKKNHDSSRTKRLFYDPALGVGRDCQDAQSEARRWETECSGSQHLLLFVILATLAGAPFHQKHAAER